MDKMREEFEVWFSNEFKYKPLSCDDGNYTTVSARASWSGWKASRAALCVELPKIKDNDYQYNQALHDVAGVLQSSGVSCK